MANNQIALLARNPELDNPVESATKREQLAALQVAAQTRQQAATDAAAQRQALMSDPSGGEGYLKSLAGAGAAAPYFAGRKANQERDKNVADVDKTKAETAEKALKLIGDTFTQYRDRVNTLGDPTQAAEWVKATFSDPVTGPFVQRVGSLETALQRIPQDPEGFAKWKQQASLSANEYIKHATVDANTIATNAQSEKNSQRTATSSKYSADSSARTANQRLTFDKQQAAPLPGAAGDTSEAMVDAIGTGRVAPPTGYALRNPTISKMMERVAQKYPEFDGAEFGARAKAMRDFSSGTPGNSIRSFAVATDHLDQLGNLVDALNNGDLPLVNKYSNIVAQQTGSTAPTNFDAAKGIVAKEVLKSIVAGGGGVEERQELAHLLENAKTPGQLKGVIDTYRHLMAAQKEGLEKQYELSTGRKDGKTRFNYKNEPAAPAANQNAKGWTLHTDAKGNKAYVSPDGTQFEEVK